MNKFDLKEKARKLRKEGLGLTAIEKEINIPRGTIHYWCKDIQLTKEHFEQLQGNKVRGSAVGRLKAASIKKEERNNRREKMFEEGKKFVLSSTNPLDTIGVALYWAEGCKRHFKFGFANSDPIMIELILRWIRESLKIKDNEIKLHLHMYDNMDEKIEIEYWKKVTKLSDEHFWKTMINPGRELKGRLQKQLHGTLNVYILKSTNLFFKIEGMIAGLRELK